MRTEFSKKQIKLKHLSVSVLIILSLSILNNSCKKDLTNQEVNKRNNFFPEKHKNIIDSLIIVYDETIKNTLNNFDKRNNINNVINVNIQYNVNEFFNRQKKIEGIEFINKDKNKNQLMYYIRLFFEEIKNVEYKNKEESILTVKDLQKKIINRIIDDIDVEDKTIIVENIYLFSEIIIVRVKYTGLNNLTNKKSFCGSEMLGAIATCGGMILTGGIGSSFLDFFGWVSCAFYVYESVQCIYNEYI